MTAVTSTPSSVVITAPGEVQLVVPAALASLLIVENGDISTVITEHTPQVSVAELVSETVVQIGQMGMRGPQGPIGPAGPASPGVTYEHQEGTPVTTWNISHNLGQFPSVTVVDTAGSLIFGAVKYVDSNTIQLNFTYPQSGTAYLN